MAKVTVEEFAAAVAQALGGRLVSLVLYGSAARGTHVPGRSDVNTILICDAADEALFQELAPALAPWVRAGHAPPLVFTREEWRDSADVFAVEYDDMRDAHRVLAGADPWQGITVPRDAARRQLERELVGKVVRLRQAYAAATGDARKLTALVADSLGGVLTMLRAVLRIAGRPVPTVPADVVRAAAQLVGFPGEVAELAAPARVKLAARDPRAAAYLAAVARTARYVDQLP